ncbi:MAG: exodeoxyribonuclease VII large subunit, partial [Pseudomonadota bacterium]
MDNLTIGRDIYNVTRLMREMRIFLEGGMPALWVAGEVSNLSRPVSGHLYFTLKDSHAQVKCVLFRNVRLRLRDEPANGRQVVVRVRP